MKYMLTLVAALVASASLTAQNLPAPSPKAKVFQTVGVTDIEIEYSSPAANGRTVWGDLVPFDELWRTGANRATKISFSTPAYVGGTEVQAGTYALFTIPGKSRITVILNSNADQGGTGSYDKALDVARFEVPFTTTSTKTERLRFTIEETTDYGANVVMNWDNRTFSVPVKVTTDAFVEKAIEDKIKEINNMHGFYNNAASFYLRSGNPNRALEMAQKSVEIKEQFWNSHTLAKAYQATGDKKMATQVAQRSLQLSKEANYDQYVKMNEELIKSLK
jgi:hypothetical protein